MHSIIRTRKHNSTGSLKSRQQHTFRTRETPNADPRKADQNRLLFGHKEYAQTAQNRLDEYAKEHNVRKNAVVAIEYLLSASPEFFEHGATYQNNPKLREWCSEQIEFLKKKHGENNILCAYLHMDEKTPHIEAYVMPFDHRGKLNCRSFLGGPKKLSELQTEYAKAMGKFGLSRGIAGSPAKHTTVKQFYAAITNRPRISNEAVAVAVTLEKPKPIDFINPTNYIEEQERIIRKKIIGLFKGIVEENKLLPIARKAVKESEREKRDMEKREFQTEKELKALKKQIEAQTKLVSMVEGLRTENGELKKALNLAIAQIEKLQQKLGITKKNELTR
jgi:hypothetical protein